jgi:hypothetical protein
MNSISGLSLGIDLFVLITFIGISIYLVSIFLRWKEGSIGTWGVGLFIISLSIIFHVIGIAFPETVEFSYRVAKILSFISFSILSFAHQVVRRSMVDIISIAIQSVITGILISLIIFNVDLGSASGLFYILRETGFNSYDIILLIYSLIFYLNISRDSEIIYQASVKHENIPFMKTKGITHLISWQFFGVGFIFIQFLPKISDLSSIMPLYFILPLILLMVPILTLGSKPFEWTREGYEPLLLLLLDQYGNISFSWIKESTSLLLLEGSAISTIIQMFDNLVGENTQRIKVEFDNSALYVETSNKYRSLLITTGSHPSYHALLQKIHSILVTSMVMPVEFGIPGYSIPDELKWLLTQLLPEGDINIDQDTDLLGIFN